MLKLENFDALKLSVASPEMILSWSHGEVTKPETINYRTLKPERDGLFCERIFGPVKDWECHCGKYKRYRYKGIICDKCGVEVTRSKVRRERMGHVKLASPVSHVWYFKGVPSRLGLLLDMSPRNLEKILYYANYVVTSIDEDARTEALKNYTIENHPRAKELREQIASGRTDEQVALEKKLVEREKKLQQERMQLDNTLEAGIHEIETGIADLQDRIRSGKGKKAAADFLLVDGQESLVAVEKGAELTEDLANKMATIGQERIDALRAQIGTQILEHEQHAGAELATLREELQSKTANEVRQSQIDLDALKEEIASSRDQLENLKVKDLLTDQQYRDYIDHFGKSFKAGMGATSVKILLSQIDLAKESAWLREESKSTSGQRRQKAIKRLRVIEAFRKSGTEPTWMIMDVLPVIPPDLRPMVQLDGGRFATSDLNDLYRRVINRNNRLKRLLELGAPEIIVRNERRMLQEAVDALIDNGRRGRAVTGTGNRKLKSLSDLLKGKQGRFRQNLLGKRVDYSGRSVIVVGPELKLHQCGLPKKMALELFKPFVMRELVNQGFTQNIKSAKRMVERVRPEVWDVLDQVIHEHPVLLNRAPTLHRLGIQAFMPVLVEGQAIQLHPLVCKAFNADFDGDQMAVHVPLFSGAVAEAKNLMMATQNVLLPSDGKPIIAPHQDIVLGNFWLTQERNPMPTDPEVLQKLKTFSSPVEASMAYDTKAIALHDPIRVRLPKRVMVGTTELQAAPEGTELVVTTVGRIIFNEALPLGERVTEGTERYLPSMVYKNQVMDVKKLVKLCKEVFDLHGAARTAHVANELKRLGFRFATQAGITVSAMDIRTPKEKYALVEGGDKEIDEINLQFLRGLITENERYQKTVQVWTRVTAEVTKVTMESFDRFDSVSMMAQSGARGSEQQIRQIAGMRGLMADPTGRLIDLPIKANFSEGLTVLEYFISTHGARKGLADTALRTADSGYLTRRLVDVAQDVIIRLEDCGTVDGIWVELEDPGQGDKVVERYSGRVALNDIQLDGKTIVSAGQEIGNDTTPAIYENRAKIGRIKVRSSMNCKAREGLCRLCYGRNLATGRMVEIGEAVGVIAAQSIGEPGTQLTMRTFHTGGVGTGVADITQGLPRVEELFEARIPKGKAIIAEIDGQVEIVREGNKPPKVKVLSRDVFDTNYQVASGSEIVVKDGEAVSEGTELVSGVDEDGSEIKIRARYSGTVKVAKGQITLRSIDEETREYPLTSGMQLLVKEGDDVQAGDQLTDGSVSPQELLLVRGKETVQSYLVREVQRVYRSQGVDINDKHIEIIVRQMLRKVRVEDAGDTSLLPGEIVSQFEWEEANASALAEGGEPAIAATVLLGLIKAALNTASWLSAASFQETTRVLTEAAIAGRTDRLRGLKENVIIGKLIPAGTGLDYYSKLREEAKRLYEEGLVAPVEATQPTESTDESSDESTEESGEMASAEGESTENAEASASTEPAETEEASAQTI